jgi:hypothetical protein
MAKSMSALLFSTFQCWNDVRLDRENKIIMSRKIAWLIGIYTYEMDCRIESLGYTLVQNFADDGSIKPTQDEPDLIVVSEDEFLAPVSYALIKELFPDVLLISVPSVSYSSLHPDFTKGKQSVARLITQIQERYHRWDN